MILKYNYYYFNDFISHKLCDHLINYLNYKKEQKATVFGDKGPKHQATDLKIRNSNIVWNSEKWVYKEIIPLFEKANREANWNFDIDWFEPTQITKYGKDQFYNWHLDQHPKPVTMNNSKKIRKLSVSILLNDPLEYEGGELEFMTLNDSTDKIKVSLPSEKLKKGTAIFFPSFLHHRVKPVTKGTRYSLVVWSCGKPFK